ncbi:hypothetical protein KM043_009368 [Ampulex compressa]|nr:hypothetical protein KM043_009368 [Ampulex compressa]
MAGPKMTRGEFFFQGISVASPMTGAPTELECGYRCTGSRRAEGWGWCGGGGARRAEAHLFCHWISLSLESALPLRQHRPPFASSSSVVHSQIVHRAARPPALKKLL